MMLIALIGKPNAGKSSFFKALTLQEVKIADYPFTTTKPNLGIAFLTFPCVCKEFNLQCEPKLGACKDGIRYVPIQIMDLVGLVPGAHRGKGLGNRFLDEARKADGFIQVIDCSGLTDAEGKPTRGYDPSQEIEFLREEIQLWFLGLVKKALMKYEKKPKADWLEILAKQLSGLGIDEKKIREVWKRTLNLERFTKEILRVGKPMIIAANKMDLPEAQTNYERLKGKYEMIPTSAEMELALKLAARKGLITYDGKDFKIIGKLNEPQAKALARIKEFLMKFGSTGIQECLNFLVFKLLNYKAVYPVENEHKLTDSRGKTLPDVFLMPNGSTVLDLAFKIHTDLGKNFMFGINVRTKQKVGKDHELKHRDVIKIIARA